MVLTICENFSNETKGSCDVSGWLRDVEQRHHGAFQPQEILFYFMLIQSWGWGGEDEVKSRRPIGGEVPGGLVKRFSGVG